MASNSCEYCTIIQCTPDLLTAVKPNICLLSADLLGVGLITSDNYDQVTNVSFDVAARASQLLNCIRTKVILDARNFHIFLNVLSRRSGDYREILSILREKYAALEASTVEVDYPKKSSVGSNSQVSHRRSFDCHKCSCTCHGPQIGEVVRILRPLKLRWFPFGLQLGVDLPYLLMIESKQYCDPERNLIDLIDCWMNRVAKAGCKPWTMLAEAVEQMDDFQQLASALRLKAIQEGEHPYQATGVPTMELKQSSVECMARQCQQPPSPGLHSSTCSSPNLIPGNDISNIISKMSFICDTSVEHDCARPHSLRLKSPHSDTLSAVNSSPSSHLHKLHTTTAAHSQQHRIATTTNLAPVTSENLQSGISPVGVMSKSDHCTPSPGQFQMQSSSCSTLHQQLPSTKSTLSAQQQHRLSAELHKSPKMMPKLSRQQSRSSPSLMYTSFNPEMETFSLDEPHEDVWLHDESFVFYSGWCLQTSEPHQLITLKFMHTLILRLMYVFAPESSRKSMSPFRRECAVWKKGLRWLNLDGIETFIEMVEGGRAIMVLMRTKKGSELRGIRLRSALISRIISTKEAVLCRMTTIEFLIDPKHLRESEKYPIITKKINQLTKYDVNLIAHAIVAPNQRRPHRYVYDTRNEYMKDLSEILYFDPYMRLGSEILYILFDKRRNTEELHEDFLFDFSQDCAEDADKFAEILLEDQHNIRLHAADQSSRETFIVLRRYWERTPNLTIADFRRDLDKYSIFNDRNILKLGRAHATSKAQDK